MDSKRPRADRWDAIENRIFGQCVWQKMSPDRRVMLEGMMHRRAGDVWIIQKSFAARIPRSGTDWPELSNVLVFAPVAPEINDWDEYEKALA
jgi:hypothetical protein